MITLTLKGLRGKNALSKVDLNCDLGESFGAYRIGNDEAILEHVTSVNVACGFHAGDPSVMRKTVKLAAEKQVQIGAHPGLQDLIGFGRRNMNISPQEAYDIVVYQIGALNGFLQAEGVLMQHVKPHGALYNMAAKNKALSEAIAKAVYNVNPELILFGLSGSELIQAGNRIGLKTANEVFAGKVKSQQGKDVELQADTICIHGDGAHALEFARHVNRSLRASEVVVKAILK